MRETLTVRPNGAAAVARSLQCAAKSRAPPPSCVWSSVELELGRLEPAGLRAQFTPGVEAQPHLAIAVTRCGICSIHPAVAGMSSSFDHPLRPTQRAADPFCSTISSHHGQNTPPQAGVFVCSGRTNTASPTGNKHGPGLEKNREKGILRTGPCRAGRTRARSEWYTGRTA